MTCDESSKKKPGSRLAKFFFDARITINQVKKLFKNDILMCTASGSKEHIGKTSFINEDILYSHHPYKKRL